MADPEFSGKRQHILRSFRAYLCPSVTRVCSCRYNTAPTYQKPHVAGECMWGTAKSWCAFACLPVPLIYTILDLVDFPSVYPLHCLLPVRCLPGPHTHVTSIVVTDACMIRPRGMLPYASLFVHLCISFLIIISLLPFKSDRTFYSLYYIVASCCTPQVSQCHWLTVSHVTWIFIEFYRGHLFLKILLKAFYHFKIPFHFCTLQKNSE